VLFPQGRAEHQPIIGHSARQRQLGLFGPAKATRTTVAEAPADVIRPDLKPPFYEGDATRISQLTRMKPKVWCAKLHEFGYVAKNKAASWHIMRGMLDGVDVEFVRERIERYGANLPVEPDFIPAISAISAADCAALKKAGPFDTSPFPNFVVSPIGVPKKVGKVRMTHHLSYPFKGDSINASVIDEPFTLSSVCRRRVTAGRGCFLIKLDVEAAYRQVPIRREDWPLLGFKWLGIWYYERCLPFGPETLMSVVEIIRRRAPLILRTGGRAGRDPLHR
jgi:hypothetical protein